MVRSHLAWLVAVVTPLCVHAQPSEARRGTPQLRNLFEAEAVLGMLTRNDAQFPNSPAGTRFAVDDIIGDDIDPEVRLTYTRSITERQELRLLYAPLALSGTGVLPSVTNFRGVAYAPGVPTTAEYRFNSYRATWRYSLLDGTLWTVKLGLTAKVRDARIALIQGGRMAEDTDLGVVPLAHAYVERRFGERLTFIGDLDALAGGPGRAIDLGLRLGYEVTDTLMATGGWRMLDGGVDTNDQFNFATVHYLTFGLAYRF
jgi:hypothetical protein